MSIYKQLRGIVIHSYSPCDVTLQMIFLLFGLLRSLCVNYRPSLPSSSLSRKLIRDTDVAFSFLYDYFNVI